MWKEQPQMRGPTMVMTLGLPMLSFGSLEVSLNYRTR